MMACGCLLSLVLCVMIDLLELQFALFSCCFAYLVAGLTLLVVLLLLVVVLACLLV